ncbi:MAG: hypothetical protein M5R42_01455 [Rhodocyclaceae bacterium]|nr:hypothetical protein [Rhodocyclaceae bacterium]
MARRVGELAGEGPSGRGGGLRHERRDQPPDRLGEGGEANPSPRELDVIASTGEQVTIGLLSMALTDIGVKARSYTGGQSADPDRQCIYQGAHRSISTRPTSGTTWIRGMWLWWRVFRVLTMRAASPRWARGSDTSAWPSPQR